MKSASVKPTIQAIDVNTTSSRFDWALLFRRFLLASLAVSVAFGLGIWFLDTQIRAVGEDAPYDVTFGPYLPKPAPTLVVTVVPLVAGIAAFVSPFAGRMPRSSGLPLLLLSLVVPVVVTWYSWGVLGDWFWLGHS
ncbi:MAG: hypothetical protein AAF497_09220 [Planctomycetota bacterium]